jgi:hypothetical protein
LATLPAPWTSLHDLRWPGRRYANIDHVVIGSSGVFVIDTKNWSGPIEVDGGVLKASGRNKAQVAESAADAAREVAALLPPAARTRTHPVICFVKDEPLTGNVDGVFICSTANLVTFLTLRPPVFDADDVREIARALGPGLAAAAAARQAVRPTSATRAGAKVKRSVRRTGSGRASSFQAKLLELSMVLVAIGGALSIADHVFPGATPWHSDTSTVEPGRHHSRVVCSQFHGDRRERCFERHPHAR